MNKIKFSIILLGLRFLLWWQSIVHKKFKTHLAEKKFTAQIQVKDKSVGQAIMKHLEEVGISFRISKESPVLNEL